MRLNSLVTTVFALLLSVTLSGCLAARSHLTEDPLVSSASIPVLPADLQERCGKVVPRVGQDARVELYRALVVIEHCSSKKEDVAEFYNRVRAVQ